MAAIRPVPSAGPASPAKLAQERSRATRRKIVSAALRLWSERGFDEGFETTTVDEIAERAEISRASVYYYFPKKEDILRELAWTTSEEIYEKSLRAIMSGERAPLVIDQIMAELGAMVARSPKSAVRRMLQVRHWSFENLARDAAAGGLTRAFSVVIVHAQEAGEIPKTVSAIEVGEMLSSIAMGCISKWAIADDVDLPAMLRRRAAVILAGAFK